MSQNELMKKEKKQSMTSHMVWLSRTVDVVHRSPRFLMLIVLHCLNLKQQIDLSLYDLISITFLMNSLLDLYVQDVLSLLSLGINT